MDTPTGPAGTAHALPIPDIPTAAETLAQWLIDAPCWHPVWSQYLIVAVRLRDGIPGFPAPTRRFPGATHEVIVGALDPGEGPHTAATLTRPDAGLPILTPVNVAEQVQATDAEVLLLVRDLVFGTVHGLLNPETGDAPDLIREQWLASMVRTLAHIRGEVHAP
jgi:hypothetical protein